MAEIRWFARFFQVSKSRKQRDLRRKTEVFPGFVVTSRLLGQMLACRSQMVIVKVAGAWHRPALM
jgi:hypothetical protein